MRVTFGVSVALLTPFASGWTIDLDRLATHARDVLRAGADGVTLFGTTGEGASIGPAEAKAALAALLRSGVEPGRVTLGVAASSVEGAVAGLSSAARHGVGGVLLAPPFYYPNPSPAGLRDWFSAVLAASDAAVPVLLYHIPQVTGAALTPGLVEALRAEHPGRVRGVKDSSGDWDTARAFLALDGLEVLIGDERLLHRAVPLGCAGAVSGMANLHPARLTDVIATGHEDAALSAETEAVVSHPVVPALKVLMARASGDPVWERVRPPLAPLEAEARAALLAATRAPEVA